ncbi:Hsp70 family protein [Aspergillus undulatus]|uniref:Hsp70 family protein n=1 Tax=Aspergillus undulatus TaxID=1810928 RepID=UPI003CCCAA7A
MTLRNASRKRRRASSIIDPASGVPASDGQGQNDVVMDNWSGSSTGPRDIRQSTMETSEPPPDSNNPPRTKFIVGLDYGTTFSSVSYIKFDPANPPKTLRGHQIDYICDWPHAGNLWRSPDVPSENWYLENKFLWGYNAREAIMGIENEELNYKNRIIQCAKLLLSENQQDTKGLQEDLTRTLHRAGKNHQDVIRDYIRELLLHSKSYLERIEAFDEDCEVEIVFCTPAGWTAKAIRDMQRIVLDAAQEITFGNLSPLYILNEPEAAAAYILEALPGRKDLETGDVFIVCDAGGGTVDTITYRVRQHRPFRVEEVVTPTGSNCGSSYVNRKLKKEVVKRLKSTPYTALKAPSPEYVLEHDLMTKFEYLVKRRFNPDEGLDGNESLVMHGLTKDDSRGFGNSVIYIPRKTIAEYFQWSLDRISKLIRQQINAAAAKGLMVEKILLVGGFSASPILRSHIAKEFELKIMTPHRIDTASDVSHGAVFRALNKADGPKRIVQSNFGFLQIEEYNPKLPAHRLVTPTDNSTDGKKYVHNVLDWVIKKNQVLRTKQPFRSRNYQTFKFDEELVITQRIYVSDFDNAQDHYQISNQNNRGAESFGLLQVDLQRVKEEGLLEIKLGLEGPFYELHYELGMEVDGRNLAVKLFCPPGGRCRGQTQLCIAAAFVPGTE